MLLLLCVFHCSVHAAILCDVLGVNTFSVILVRLSLFVSIKCRNADF